MTGIRIAFLCKRRYMGKDVIADRYGRLYEIPRQLAALGHDVHAWCLSYADTPAGRWQDDAVPGRLTWESASLGKTKLPALLAYPLRLHHRLHQWRPDVLIAASDIPHVALGAYLARRLGIPFVADLYDNFEGFGQARIPGFVPALRRAVRSADLVTTTSEALRELVVNEYRARGKVIAMPSTVDKSVFHPRDKAACRKALGLPVEAKLIGTAGGLLASRGISDLYDAWRLMAAKDRGVHLVLAGPADAAVPPPSDPRVHYLGMIPHAETAKLFAALDVGVIYLRDTPFGRYCFPQKAYEMMACSLPIAATAVGAMPALFGTNSQSLYRQGDAADLARAINAALEARAAPVATHIPDWAETVGVLAGHLAKLR